MTFQPVVVGSGLVGWQFLKSTEEAQRSVFDQDASLTRDTDYFASKIAEITDAESLVADRRLLRVALGAFGLQDDIDNKFFIKTILEQGTTDSEALANRLTDDRYKALASAFEFDNPIRPGTQSYLFADEIVEKFRTQEFEIAVGNQDESLRLSMNLIRSLPEISAGEGSDDTKWFRVMGTSPVRTVFETALALPSSFGQIDLDKQLETFRDRMESRFGVSEIDELADPDVLDRIVETYLLQAQSQQFAQSSQAQVALTLLQNIPNYSQF